MMDLSIIGNTTATFGEILSGWLTLERVGILAGIAIGEIAVVISKYGILPDIEPRYEFKQIASEFKKFPIQRDFLNKYKNRYGDMYSHFILFNV